MPPCNPRPGKPLLALLGLVVLGCSASEGQQPSTTDARATGPAPPSTSDLPSTGPGPVVLEVETDPMPDLPPAASHADLPTPFDAEGATAFDARIVDLFDRTGWVPCGYIHSVGAVEVEVLGHGEPGPHVMLLVSCPVDFGHRKFIEADARVHVTVHKRKQRWPMPAKARHTDLPKRYVEGMTSLDPDSL